MVVGSFRTVELYSWDTLLPHVSVDREAGSESSWNRDQDVTHKPAPSDLLLSEKPQLLKVHNLPQITQAGVSVQILWGVFHIHTSTSGEC